MTEKTKIGIVGLGMIGGSIALALNGKYEVVGYDIDPRSCEYASGHGFCRVVSPDDMADCKVVFVCVPVAVMKETLSLLSDKLCGVIISDVASVKTPFKATGGRYVGGHPMAGTEKGGITAAKTHLFQNAYWVITGEGEDAAVVSDIVSDTGALPLMMSAEEHDRAVSAFSHAPHVAAYALTSAAVKAGVQPIAGSGFLDTTRIAQSDEKFWTEVLMLNADNVSGDIRSLISELDSVDKLIASGDRAALTEYLAAARQKRKALSRVDLGGVALYVDLVDRVGEFERITGAIARAGINVCNIALVPGREGASGALRLEFADQKDRAKAAAILQADGTTDGKE